MGLTPRFFSYLTRLGAVVLVAAALGACAPHRPVSGPVPEVPSVAPGTFLSAQGDVFPLDRLAAFAGQADYVLLGEGHASACDHLAQARMLEALCRAACEAGRPVPALGLEMVSVDHQPVLDRFNSGEIGADGLAKALDWKKVWGYGYELYRPVFEVAEAQNMPLVALNVPRRVTRTVGREGTDALTKADRVFLPKKILPPSREQQEFLQEQFALHQKMMKGAPERMQASVSRFQTVQSIWDTAMAENAMKARHSFVRPIAIIVGSGHVEYGWGIEHRLATLDPEAQVYSIAPWRGGDAPEPDLADAFFYCPPRQTLKLGLVVEMKSCGAQVVSIAAGSRAEKAGLKEGDCIVRAQGMPVEALWTLHKAAVRANREDKGRLRFDVLREGTSHHLTIQLSRTSRKGTTVAPTGTP
ncbi:ChaN family lipoprotein [Desulfobaculum bizertense]|uniref:Uncharacterized iron-regulated protein n=1 Tax=Desulfobaculum bizertense DSM 18034 TaxID=1121442 RepID=A0A1T4VII4_9BACT|nr:ChaN family lipoprotein [Desulfobaculum bizertense]UIJ37907.1 ChaN family lipoprotein [Desulfobaculum bizertense]SKA64698.1 Uncharacterized iron-regulated protein [Desulfobaculum bizertense DSM 18034]